MMPLHPDSAELFYFVYEDTVITGPDLGTTRSRGGWAERSTMYECMAACM